MKAPQHHQHHRTRACVATIILATASVRAAAQAAPRETAAQRNVAVVIFAEASAGSVTFRAQPQLHVRLSGGTDLVRVLERRNLPSPVVVGTTYNNVYVAVEIFGRLNAECISNALTGGARLDCASLDVRGATRPPSDTSKTAKTPRS